MNVDLLYLARNRLHYVKHSLPALLADPGEKFSLILWDNASTDGTREFMESVKDPRIVRRVLSPENISPYKVCNKFVTESKADLVGFTADDLLVTPGWVRTLTKVHEDVPELGRVACWHLKPGSFNYELAQHKMQTFAGHTILRHPWTNGCGLTKRKAMVEAGEFSATEGESRYWIRVALKGYIVGFYYPLIPVEHMDDPWTEHFAHKGRFDEWLSQSSTAKNLGLRDMADVEAWHQEIVRNILCDPWQAEYYVGWRRKATRLKRKFVRLLTGSRF